MGTGVAHAPAKSPSAVTIAQSEAPLPLALFTLTPTPEITSAGREGYVTGSAGAHAGRARTHSAGLCKFRPPLAVDTWRDRVRGNRREIPTDREATTPVLHWFGFVVHEPIRTLGRPEAGLARRLPSQSWLAVCRTLSASGLLAQFQSAHLAPGSACARRATN